MDCRPRRLVTRAWLILVFLAGLPAIADAEEFYFVLVFGSQSHPKQLRYTHTWATFVRAVGEGPDRNTYQLDAHTISWYPASLDVRVWALEPERGVNLTLEQTLAVVYANGEHVTMWGPFVANARVYNRSVEVYHILNSGRVQYRAISTRADPLISDCIHAVAAVDPDFGRDHYPLIRIGLPASRFIAREIVTRSVENQGINQSLYDNSWLIPRLGLNAYPIHIVPPWEIPLRRCFFCLCGP
jgi:hypothetical protein